MFTNLRMRLREETADIHHQLHSDPSMHRLVNGDMDLPGYIKILEVFYSFYQPIETFFSTGHIHVSHRFTPEASVVTWLLQDFQALGHSPVLQLQHRFASLDSKAYLTTGSNLQVSESTLLDTYLGYLYVKQGSTLGGQAISKCLTKSLALQPGRTLFFFHGFAEQTRVIWSQFTDYLQTMEPKVNPDNVVRAAQYYFSVLQQQLTFLSLSEATQQKTTV